MARITSLATLLAAFMLLLTIASANPVHHKHKGANHHAGGKGNDNDVDDDNKPHHGAAHHANNNGGKDPSDFNFKPSHQAHISCPSSSGRTWTGGRGTKFGVLCGWDTRSHTSNWPVLHHLTPEQCVKACSHIHDCTVATHTGTGCYLKKHANGKGYYKVGKGFKVVSAIKLNRGHEGSD